MESIEHLPLLRWDELTETAYEDFIQAIITMNTEYTLTVDDIKAESYVFMDNLIPSCENVFLY